MMGIEFMGDIPFSDVLIHSIIQAPDGRRMSKSLGTGINPLDLVDALRRRRHPLRPAEDVARPRTCGSPRARSRRARKLANKLWNAARFALAPGRRRRGAAPPRRTAARGRWIVAAGRRRPADVLRQIDGFDFAAAIKELYAFVWNDFCDWYVEAAKLRLATATSATPQRRRRCCGCSTGCCAWPTRHAVRDRGDLGASCRASAAC